MIRKRWMPPLQQQQGRVSCSRRAAEACCPLLPCFQTAVCLLAHSDNNYFQHKRESEADSNNHIKRQHFLFKTPAVELTALHLRRACCHQRAPSPKFRIQSGCFKLVGNNYKLEKYLQFFDKPCHEARFRNVFAEFWLELRDIFENRPEYVN